MGLSFRQRQRPVKHAAALCPGYACGEPARGGKSAVQRYAAARFCINGLPMDGASLDRIFERIDAALGRIEGASRPAPADGDLAVRHEQLRAAAAQTLRQLDALIAEHEL